MLSIVLNALLCWLLFVLGLLKSLIYFSLDVYFCNSFNFQHSFLIFFMFLKLIFMFVQESVNAPLEGNMTGFLCLLKFIVQLIYD